jgi:undecaprenyl-diphosphatase
MSIIDKILPAMNHWGYWIVLLAATMEAIPLLGLFIPGQVIVILGGLFARLHVLRLSDVIIVASAGAILGDLIGYFLGRKYGYSLLSTYGKHFFFKKEYFDKTRKLIKQHSGKALLIGRFNWITRPLAPFASGSAGVPFWKFLIYNVIGGIAWAASFALIGYVFGTSYEVAAKYLGTFVVAAVILIILISLAYHFVNKKKHIFTKYHLYALILNGISLYLFSKMVEDVVDAEAITKFDIWLNHAVQHFWTPWLNTTMILVTSIASTWILLLLSVILFGVLIRKKKWFNSVLLVCSLLGGVAMELLTKYLIQRARPENALISASNYSFPSGHSTMAIIFFSLLFYSFKDEIRSCGLKTAFIMGNVLLVLLIGFSRVYLGVHWFSDVIAGYALGLFWLTLLILVFKVILAFSGRYRGASRPKNIKE